MQYRLKVGHKCNNNCIICSDLDLKAETEKSFNEIVQEIQDIESNEVILPCNADIRKDFVDILRYIKEKDKKVILETNGRIFKYLDFCEAIKDYIDEIVIIFWGNDPNAHDKITKVNGSFIQSLKGEENLMKILPKEKIKILPFYTDNPIMFEKPEEVVIELTSQCNFNCQNCFNKASFAKNGRENKEMTTEYVKEIIHSISNNKIPRVRFSGGEPLLRDDLFELMEYASSKGLIIWFNTNGSLITEEIVMELEKYVENVLIPFNGYDDKSDFLWTKEKNSFEKKLKGVKLLKKSKIPIIRGGTIATPENIENLEKIYRIIKEKNLDFWEVWRPIPLKKENVKIDVPILYEKLIKLSLDFRKPIYLANSIPFCSYDIDKMELISLGACYDDGHSRIIVDPAGFAKPSYFIHKNIGDPKDILSCWNHEFMKKMRNLSFVPKECKDCRVIEKCKGGSRYVADLCFGGFDKKDILMENEFRNNIIQKGDMCNNPTKATIRLNSS